MGTIELDKTLRLIQDIVHEGNIGRTGELIELLDDKLRDSRVLWAASWGLARLYDPAAAVPLVGALERRDLYYQVFAQVTDPQVLDLMQANLREERPQASRPEKRGLLRRILRLPAPPNNEAAEERCKRGTRDCRILTSLGWLNDPRATDLLLQYLNELDEDDGGFVAAQSLLRRGSPEIQARVIDKAIHEFTDADMITFESGTEATVAVIAPYLGSSEAEERRTAVAMLSALGDPKAIDTLRRALKDPDQEVRLEAVQGLDDYPQASATDALADALADDDPEIRTDAAEYLAWRDDSRCVDVLWDSVRDSFRQWRAAGLKQHKNHLFDLTSLYHLSRLSGPGTIREELKQILLETIRSWGNSYVLYSGYAFRALIAIAGNEAKGVIEPFSNSKHHEIRISALDAVRRMGDERGLDGLLSIVRTEDIHPCVLAAKALAIGGVLPKSAFETLESALYARRPSPLYFPTSFIAPALGKTGDPRGLPHLLALVEEPEMTEAALAGLSSLLKYGGPGLSANDLEAIMDLRDVYLHRYESLTADYDEIREICEVDFRPVKRMAADELHRRENRLADLAEGS